jgi:hypothetical protein
VYIVLLFLFCASVPHVIAAQFLDLNECTTLHRTNAPGQVKVNRKAFLVFTASLSRLLLFLLAFSRTIPCTHTISHGVSHHCTASVCAPARRWLPPDSQRRERRRSPTITRKILRQLIAVGSTSTVDHGAFSTGSSKRRTTTARVPTTVPHGPNAQQQGRRWQAAVASHGTEKVSGLQRRTVSMADRATPGVASRPSRV